MMNSIIRLAGFMSIKLSENSHKDGWGGLTLQHLSMRITQEKQELIRAVQRGATPEQVWREAADIANFAMMIAENYEDEYLPEEHA